MFSFERIEVLVHLFFFFDSGGSVNPFFSTLYVSLAKFEVVRRLLKKIFEVVEVMVMVFSLKFTVEDSVSDAVIRFPSSDLALDGISRGFEGVPYV